MIVWLIIVGTSAPSAGAEPPFPEPANLAHLVSFCEIDNAALDHLRENGLVVLPAAQGEHLQGCYYSLEMAGLPVYVTADAMLYLWYEAHRKAMMEAEREFLRPQLLRFATGMLDATQRLRAQGQDPLLRRNAVMLAVLCKLLGPDSEPPGDLAQEVAGEVGRVMEHTLLETYPGDDYTQYKVRGHYADDPELSAYFRGAKYLSRRYFRVVDPRDPAAAAAETQQAALLALAMREGEGLLELYRGIYDLRALLAGPADTIRLDQLLEACNAVWGPDWDRDRAEDRIAPLQDELTRDEYPTTRITNRAVPSPGAIAPRNVAVLGEHYLPDSELFQRTIDPRVPGRALPTGLEVAAALGSAPAMAKLAPLTSDFPRVVPIVREFGPQMTSEGVYGDWLATLRTLFDRPEGLPAFARTAAYDEKQINCCLTSWAQLRHSYILYGAQAYSVSASTSGVGLVEPLPEFFAEYAAMCRKLTAELEAREVEGRPTDVLRALADKAQTFERCAADQLAGRDISWAADHIHGFGTWMGRVFYDNPLVVADVATDAYLERVLHAASGPFRQIVVLLEGDGGWRAAVGYVGSYYEFIEPEMHRLDDAEWKTRVEDPFGAPEQPPWLALLGRPRSEEQARMDARLRELRAILERDGLEAGTQAIDGFVTEHEDTEWAPAAIVVLARHLEAAGEYKRAAEVAERAQPMYGCDARDEALALMRHAKWRMQDVERAAEEEREFGATLAATGPTEGLSPEAELARQNERARLLLERAGGGFGDYGSRSVPHLERLIRECPDSGYRPFAELALLLAERSGPCDPYWSPLPASLATRLRDGFRDVAGRYGGSAVGLAAQAAAASVLYWSGELEACYAEVKPLLGRQPPDPEPYPLSAACLADEGEEMQRPDLPHLTAESLLDDVGSRLIVQAAAEGDLELFRELAALPREDSWATPGFYDWVPESVEYFADGPDELRAYLRLRGMCADEIRPEGTPEDLLAEAARIADEHPGSKVAPAALYLALRETGYGHAREEAPEELKAVWQRLVDGYPESPEALVAQVQRLLWTEHPDDAKAALNKVELRYPDGRETEGAPAYVRSVLRDLPDPTEYPVPGQTERRVAKLKEQWGTWTARAGIDDAFLAECWGAPPLVEELVRRLPDRELEILLDIPTDERNSYLLPSVASPVLERHPDDPRTLELRWRLGGFDHLLAIVAAGPDAPHFAEAVERLELWPNERQRKLRQSLFEYRQAAEKHAGTPAETLAVALSGRLYLNHDRPEQAAELIEGALERTGEGTPLRDRLTALLEAAQRRIAAKQHPYGAERLWEVPINTHALDGSDCPWLLADGRLFVPAIVPATVGAGTARVVCIETATGKTVWEAPTGLPLRSMHLAGGRLVGSVDRGEVFCLDAASGERLWLHELGLSRMGKVWCDADGDTVLAYWDQGLLRALDCRTGEVKWESDALLADAPPVILADLFCVRTRANVLSARRVRDGREAWAWDWRSVVLPEEVDRFLPDSAFLAATRGGHLAALHRSMESTLVVLDRDSGRPRWTKRLEGNQRFVRARGNLAEIVVAGESATVGLAEGDGSVVWSARGAARGGVALAGDRVAVSNGGRLLIVDRALGETVGTIEAVPAEGGIGAESAAGGPAIVAVSGAQVSGWRLEMR